ncbi:hypothetical protein FI667_g14934, partial [Globisporangium splendens]
MAPSHRRSWWKCANGAACAAPLAPTPSLETDAPPSLLLLKELPATPTTPLAFFCATCSLRMALCECCDLLVDAEKAVDGVLLCTRCGFLTVVDPTLRSLVQTPPCNRSILKRMPVAIAELVTLRQQLVRSNEQLHQLRAQQQDSEPTHGVHSQPVPPVLPQKRRRHDIPEDTSEPGSLPFSPPLSYSVSGDLANISVLENETKALERKLRHVMRQWESVVGGQTATTTVMDEAPTSPLSHLQQSFSTTHLNILKSMYEKNPDMTEELSDLAHQIEQFLLHQSTLVKMKYDLLTAVQTSREIEQLDAPEFQSQTAPNVAKLIINSAKEQLQHLYQAFQTQSRPYLKLIGCANKHLFALYNAAQSLQKMRQSTSSLNDRNDDVVLGIIREHALGGRRRYGVRQARAGISSATTMRSDSKAVSVHDEVSRVQQTIELGNRMTEIAKKVELWRSLSATIASTCVLSLLELSSTNAEPLV